jgi:hypothetical protein
MSYTKQSLIEAKKKLYKQNPSFFKDSKNKRSPDKIIIHKHTKTTTKKIVKWNYKVNDIVSCKASNRIGLIISDNLYFGRKVEKNYFFVLFGEAVLKYDGSKLRKL